KRQAHYLRMSLSHVIGHSVAILVHRRPDVAVTHETLLHADGSANRIEPRPIRMPESMSAESADLGSLSSALQFAPYPCVTVWQLADFDWTGKHPVALGTKLRCLPPNHEHVEQFFGDNKCSP